MRGPLAKGRTGLVVYQLVLIIIALAIIAFVLYTCARRAASPPGTSTAASGPFAAPKPAPVELPDFQGCPPNGDGGDRSLNLLKNRIDSATAYVPMSAEAILQLTWPRGAENSARARWSVLERAEVSRREGTPVVVEGYIAGAKVEGPESTNCHGKDSRFRDWHIWLTAANGDPRSRSVVVETTPRVRAMHPTWKSSALHRAQREGTRVRVSGWLLLDQEHPEQLGKTRGTLWEIHPITKIELARGVAWHSLDAVP